jgi:hypothetical protein
MLDDQNQPFTTFEPGQLITAEAMNAMQGKMRSTIHDEIAKALEALKEIDRSKDSDALGGQTAEDLLQKFLEKAMQEFPSHTGYRMLFKVLESDERNPIKHELKLSPLVDLYELIPFDVVCAHDADNVLETVLFYLYHTSEKRLRVPAPGTGSIEIEDEDPPFRIPLVQLLELFSVEYSDASGLGDLETELWTVMFADPNDQIDPSLICHSPWYERCCREERTVGSLKERGDWDELWVKMRPRKTVNATTGPNGNVEHFPAGVVVEHHDFDTLSLLRRGGAVAGERPQPLNLMVLLKV